MPAHVAGHSLEAAAELVDLDGESAEHGGVSSLRPMLVDECAAIRTTRVS